MARVGGELLIKRPVAEVYQAESNSPLSPRTHTHGGGRPSRRPLQPCAVDGACFRPWCRKWPSFRCLGWQKASPDS
jgi:hypothetical protein